MGLLLFWRGEAQTPGSATATISTIGLTLEGNAATATGSATVDGGAQVLTLTPLAVTVGGAPVVPPRPPGGHVWRYSTVLVPVNAFATVERLTLQLIPQAPAAHGEVDDLRRRWDEAEMLFFIMDWDLADLLALDEELVDAL